MKKILSVIFMIILSFWSIKPLFHPGFFPVHDNAQPERIYEMAKALQDGMFPVRWVNDFGFGYGYPLFNFYAPLAYYIGAFIVLLSNIDILTATKIMMGLGIILSGVFMYLLAREFWGELGGIVSGIFYLYAPYHAVDIYVRGDVAETYAYAFVPLVFFGFYKIFSFFIEERSKIQSKNEKLWKWISIASLSFAALILSHNLTAMMVTPFLLAILVLFGFNFYKMNNLFNARFLLYAFVLGLLLSAFYWIPALLELQYTNVLSQTGGGFDFHKHFVCFFQLWYSPWGYGGSVPGCTDGLSFMIGKFHILLSLFAIFVAFQLSGKEKQIEAILFSLTGLAVSVLLTTDVTTLVWELIKPMAFFQFPWRFLIMICFFASFLSGASVWLIKKKFSQISSYIYVIGIGTCIFWFIFSSSKFFVQKEFYHASSSYFTDHHVIAWNMSQDASEYMPKNFAKPKDQDQLPAQVFEAKYSETSVQISSEKTQKKLAMFSTPTSDMLHVNIAYFPAWSAFIDGQKNMYTVSPTGMDIPLPAGKHTVTFVFVQTFFEKLANIISLAGIGMLILGIILSSTIASPSASWRMIRNDVSLHEKINS